MERNEPTTGEIVRALRCDGDANNCVDCRYATYDTATILCDQEQNVRDAADRLESQEQTIAALTARAESAERERDAAIKDITRLCTRCKHWACPNDDEPCLSCLDAESGNPNWTWRGLPQEGEGEE